MDNLFNCLDMKVTALLPDDLIEEVKRLSGGKNITESLVIALQDYISRQRIQKTIKRIKEKPLQFIDGFTAESVRSKNREAWLLLTLQFG